MAQVWECELEVNEFELHSRYNIHIQSNNLWKITNPFLFFHENSFGIKYTRKLVCHLNKETKSINDQGPKYIWFDLVSLFNGISTFVRLFNARDILPEH